MIESSLGRLVLVNTELSACDLDSTVHVDSDQSERATLSAVWLPLGFLRSSIRTAGSLSLHSRPHIILEEAQSIVHSPSARFKVVLLTKALPFHVSPLKCTFVQDMACAVLIF
jgi:hypothetical protein